MDGSSLLTVAAVGLMFFLMMRHGGGCCGSGHSRSQEIRMNPRPNSESRPQREQPGQR